MGDFDPNTVPGFGPAYVEALDFDPNAVLGFDPEYVEALDFLADLPSLHS
jgi:hypothetical protein